MRREGYDNNKIGKEKTLTQDLLTCCSIDNELIYFIQCKYFSAVLRAGACYTCMPCTISNLFRF